MQYKPQKENHYPEYIAFGAMIAAVTLYLLSRFQSPVRPVLQAAAVVLFIVGLQFLIRFTMTEFIYELQDDNLIIHKKVGRRQVVFCDLTLRLAKEVFEKPTSGSFEKEHGKMTRIYNCCTNFMPQHAHVFIFTFADKPSALIFEPNDIFLQEMKDRITQYRAQAPDETCDITKDR